MKQTIDPKPEWYHQRLLKIRLDFSIDGQTPAKLVLSKARHLYRHLDSRRAQDKTTVICKMIRDDEFGNHFTELADRVNSAHERNGTWRGIYQVGAGRVWFAVDNENKSREENVQLNEIHSFPMIGDGSIGGIDLGKLDFQAVVKLAALDRIRNGKRVFQLYKNIEKEPRDKKGYQDQVFQAVAQAQAGLVNAIKGETGTITKQGLARVCRILEAVSGDVQLVADLVAISESRLNETRRSC